MTSTNVKGTYVGPARTLRLGEGGKPHHPGDPITLSRRQFEALRKAGHQFDGIADAELPTPQAVPEVQPEGADTPVSGKRR